MLALRSAKALQEKILLKVQGIRKLPGCGYGDCWTRSQSDNTVGYPHGFSIRISHRVVNFKKVEKVSEMADIEDRLVLHALRILTMSLCHGSLSSLPSCDLSAVLFLWTSPSLSVFPPRTLVSLQKCFSRYQGIRHDQRWENAVSSKLNPLDTRVPCLIGEVKEE
ncbi:hypothetical protein Tco_0781028 [Tanacetum coccineum]